jgi:hypothetical protein
MFLNLSRSKYGPLVQAAAGLLCLVISLFVLSRIMLVLGALLIVWAAVTGIGRLRARRERDQGAGL